MKRTIARYNKGDESSETALVESRAEKNSKTFDRSIIVRCRSVYSSSSCHDVFTLEWDPFTSNCHDRDREEDLRNTEIRRAYPRLHILHQFPEPSYTMHPLQIEVL
ncbi:uncharacterized protein LOC133723572 isoform X5 [Rosa rugosa]|uniref:uncharacterized protein LOC133723572 isoform X5 n=1 Tax=Rosa rugosa TaxID=74645 RepID=UPI002B40172C|nr:uncharacterized protein LOC133723572 isoform X5 [Rosa rugosa]